MRIGEVYSAYQNSYKVSEITSSVKTQQALPTEQDISVKENNLHNNNKTQKEEESREPLDFNNFSLTFQKNNTYDYIGRESSLENLDMQKAISDMQKDKILQEYQYFVGSAGMV